MVESGESSGLGDDILGAVPRTIPHSRPAAKAADGKKPVIFLQFTENKRPSYFGSWSKRSKCVNGTAPVSRDEALFDYDIDSDDEWEEPADGEDLGDDGEELEEGEKEEEEEEANDGFTVPDGYLSDEEGQGGNQGKRTLADGETAAPAPKRKKNVFAKFSQTGVEFDTKSIVESLNEENESVAHLRGLSVYRSIVYGGQYPIKCGPPLPTVDSSTKKRPLEAPPVPPPSMAQSAVTAFPTGAGEVNMLVPKRKKKKVEASVDDASHKPQGVKPVATPPVMPSASGRDTAAVNVPIVTPATKPVGVKKRVTPTSVKSESATPKTLDEPALAQGEDEVTITKVTSSKVTPLAPMNNIRDVSMPKPSGVQKANVESSVSPAKKAPKAKTPAAKETVSEKEEEILEAGKEVPKPQQKSLLSFFAKAGTAGKAK